MGTLNRCVIIGGGDCSAKILQDNIISSDFIICADSGFDMAKKCGITSKLLIGDFDSVSAVPENIDKITLPVEKDVTDSVAAFNEGVKLGFKKFLLLGGTGGRFEHTFANISLMAQASRDNIELLIIDENHIFRSITNSHIKIEKKPNQQVSVFAYGGNVNGLTLKGFHYCLDNYDLSAFDGALGTSNDIVDAFGEISVKDGTLIIVETRV